MLAAPIAMLVLALPGDTIAGRVVTTDTLPVDNATVTVSGPAGPAIGVTHTSVDGRYLVVTNEVAGSYRVDVHRLGFAPAVAAARPTGAPHRFAADVILRPAAVAIDRVTVRAQQADSATTADVGGTGRALTPDVLNRLPVDPGDLTAAAALALGVVATAATDTTAAAFSVAGRPTSQNRITLDGLTFGPGAVPPDAVKATKIITNTYDVARGQFTGGQVASTTRRGGDAFEGNLTYALRDPSLEGGGAPVPAFSREYRQDQLNGSAGGALVADRLYGFAAFQFQRKTNPLATLLTADPLTLDRLGVSAQTAAAFADAVTAQKIPLIPPGVGTEQVNNNGSALARLDYVVNSTVSIGLRADWHGVSQSGTRADDHGYPQNAGEGGAQGGGLMGTLTTESRVFAGKMTNDVRVYGQTESHRSNGYLAIPHARIIATSLLAGDTPSATDLNVGPNGNFPWRANSRLFEATDEVAWIAPDDHHRVKVGILLDAAGGHTDSIPNQTGFFIFNSLDDFVARQPASYTRVLSVADQSTARYLGAVYAGDAWRPAHGLEVDYGLRAEGARYGDRPAYNGAVDSAFGRRTDRFPSELHVSPRVGLTYTTGGAVTGIPDWGVRAGGGEFRGVLPPYLLAGAAGATGLAGSQAVVTCTGSGVPTPDWAAYLANPASIPSSCTGPAGAGALPSVVVMAPDLQAPRVWRASIGGTRRLAGSFALSVDMLYAHGVSQLGSTDLNLARAPQFVLPNEANRPVYVPAASIDPATGATSLNLSRIDPAFGTVTQVNSSLHSETRQLVVGVSGLTAGGVTLNTSYTLTRSRDQSFGYPGDAYRSSTAGDPNRAQWGTSDGERRHQFLATATYPFAPSVELAIVTRLTSGAPYTPFADQDIIGTGQRNDRAFIFDPATTTDTVLANGLRRYLSTGPADGRACLSGQLGRLAQRNSCRGPWTPGLDLQLNVTPGGARLDRRLLLSFSALNVLVGVDELLHGAAHLQGWGQDGSVESRLLYVSSFDPRVLAYHYTVNQRFGTTSGSLNPFRTPFVLAIQGRFSVGADPTRRAMQQVVRARGAAAPTVAELRDRLGRGIPNPYRAIAHDSTRLGLSSAQTAALAAAAAALDATRDTVLDAVARVLADQAAHPDPAAAAAQLAPRTAALRALTSAALADARRLLSSEQWARVSESIKAPFAPPKWTRDQWKGEPGGND